MKHLTLFSIVGWALLLFFSNTTAQFICLNMQPSYAVDQKSVYRIWSPWSDGTKAVRDCKGKIWYVKKIWKKWEFYTFNNWDKISDIRTQKHWYDGRNIFFWDKKIAQADYQSFWVLNNIYSYDKNYIYEYWDYYSKSSVESIQNLINEKISYISEEKKSWRYTSNWDEKDIISNWKFNNTNFRQLTSEERWHYTWDDISIKTNNTHSNKRFLGILWTISLLVAWIYIRKNRRIEK